MSQGYVRIGTDLERNDAAVQWWYSWESPTDRWAFARGGRCRTVREARRLIRECEAERERERRAYLERYEAVLLEDGSLRPIDRGPYDFAPQT